MLTSCITIQITYGDKSVGDCYRVNYFFNYQWPFLLFPAEKQNRVVIDKQVRLVVTYVEFKDG